MKRYEAYKDSGVEWIGEIPEGWEVKPLKHLAKITLGKMLTPEDKGGYVLKPYLRSQNIQINNVNISDIKEMWFSKNELAKYRLKKEDILVNEGGDIGRTCIWNTELDECYIQNSVNRVQMIGGDSKYFLYHFFLHHQTGYFDSIVNRVSIPHLTKEKLENVLFISPPLDKQTQIANFLDQKTAQIDKLISDKEKLVALLNEERSAVINQAVTKGINPNVPMKNSGVDWLGEISEHWFTVKFTMLIAIRHGHQFMNYDFTEKGIKIIKITQLNKDGTLDLSKCSFISESILDNFNTIIIKEGDILMCLTGGTIGKIIRVGSVSEPLLQNYRVGHFSSKDDFILDNNFIFWLMTSDVVISQIFYHMRETGQPNIGMEDFNKMLIAIPPIVEQTKIVEHITFNTKKIDTIKRKVQNEISLLKEYKTALISEVVTGKVDVRNEVLA